MANLQNILSTEEIDAIRERVEKVPEGPWTTTDESWIWGESGWDRKSYCWQDDLPEDDVRNKAEGYGTCSEPDDCEGHDIPYPPVSTIHGPKKEYPGGEEGGYYLAHESADFIAHARTDVPALVRSHEALRKALDRAKECLRVTLAYTGFCPGCEKPQLEVLGDHNPWCLLATAEVRWLRTLHTASTKEGRYEGTHRL